MFKSTKRFVATILVLCGATQSNAAPVRYDCTLINDTAQGGYLSQLEEIIIDREANSIVLSRPHPSGDGTKMLMNMTQGYPQNVVIKVNAQGIKAAGFWELLMYFFEMNDVGTATLTVSGLFPASSFQWTCH